MERSLLSLSLAVDNIASALAISNVLSFILVAYAIYATITLARILRAMRR